MRIISVKALRDFWARHPDSEQALLSWIRHVEKEEWDTPANVREIYPTASFVSGNRVVFNLRGNRYRLVVWIHYRRRSVYIKWLGTHAEYDRIDVEKVE